jgi:hypothetical protein
MRAVVAGIAMVLVCVSCGTPPNASSLDAGGSGADDTGPDGGTRWQDLYATYFGPTGRANCSQARGACHTSESDLGFATSGFVCGATRDSCWQGMTQGLDAGYPVLVPAGATDPATTPLWEALYKGAPSGGAMNNNMPQTLNYTFSASDLARISAWIRNGALND